MESRCGIYSTRWRRVALIDMTDPTANCPGGLREVSNSTTKQRARGRNVSRGCSSVTFPIGEKYILPCLWTSVRIPVLHTWCFLSLYRKDNRWCLHWWHIHHPWEPTETPLELCSKHAWTVEGDSELHLPVCSPRPWHIKMVHPWLCWNWLLLRKWVCDYSTKNSLGGSLMGRSWMSHSW